MIKVASALARLWRRGGGGCLIACGKTQRIGAFNQRLLRRERRRPVFNLFGGVIKSLIDAGCGGAIVTRAAKQIRVGVICLTRSHGSGSRHFRIAVIQDDGKGTCAVVSSIAVKLAVRY